MESKVTDATDESNKEETVHLSKNQLKKLKKREKWLAIKHEKRRNAKLKRKLRLAEMRENGEDVGPTRKSLKMKAMKNSACSVRVVIDLSLDEYMGEKDINSLTCQLQHSYAANRRAENPVQLYFCGISGRTKERLDRIGDYRGWDIYPETQSYEKVFPKEDLVYLSSESSNMLTTLSDDKVYVIGGLVDHNRHKGLCHKLAEERGIAHAQLPITEYLDMKSRKVLTVNQVFSILLRYTETKDWQKAFLAEMPQRKQAFVKEEPSYSTPSTISTVENETSISGSGSQEPNSAGTRSATSGLLPMKGHSDEDEAPAKCASNSEELTSTRLVISANILSEAKESDIDTTSQPDKCVEISTQREDNQATCHDETVHEADNIDSR
ncbi:tRNA (guanine(9)-n1)-methyltransferase [Plakobranchus ocellatus]|uniref:tRNA (guanine(9)-N(1))-methyltransferase n=1 Tax=Plakobranchus ocellatus TaxID=259542 RepID=A0AAV4BW02_9GAST|nr:tRNA (guanine(9)-n1)-methyltransferase [Plakobranchus ocellatus]